jgi:pimeloyl-ACP methyl ester carboxylesterase
MPRWLPLIPLTIALAEWRAGFDADEVDAVAAARALRAPLLAIVDGADPRMPEAVVRRVLDAHPGPKRLWVAPGADHVGAILHPEYWTVVLGFLEENGL